MKHNPTKEQSDIISAAETGENIAIIAFAGAAKTSTCLMVAENDTVNSLYIAFNKSIAEEAAGKFPQNIDCRTLHSIAYKAIVKFPKSAWGKRLQANLRASDFDKLINRKNYSYLDLVEIELPIDAPADTERTFEYKDLTLDDFNDDVKSSVKYKTISMIKKFCQSKYMGIEEFLIKYPLTETNFECISAELIIDYWNELSNPQSDFIISHDIYLKLFQLQQPVLPYDRIYLDEAQDSNPVTLDIFYRQNHAQLIMVGDPYQAIYEWRGATNAMANIPNNFKTYYLTQSFRFTQSIADLAFNITKLLGNDRPIIGMATDKEAKNQAMLCRTNVELLTMLLNAVDNKHKAFVYANLDDLWSKLYHLQALKFNDKPKWPNAELSEYPNWEAIYRASKKDADIAKLLTLFNTLLNRGSSLHSTIQAIKDIIVTKQDMADIIFSTGHKSKGLEFDRVCVSTGFYNPGEDEDLEDFLNRDQNGNLLYVAVTRGKYSVTIPEALQTALNFNSLEY